MIQSVHNVLFLCADNATRSVFAASILSKDGAARFRAFSAGGRTRPAFHPLALRILESFGYPLPDGSPKNWRDFSGPNAPEMDFVLTVCDLAAPENCPEWPGQPVLARWHTSDPDAVRGSELEKATAFAKTFYELKSRIALFVALPFDSLRGVAMSRVVRPNGPIGVDAAWH